MQSKQRVFASFFFVALIVGAMAAENVTDGEESSADAVVRSVAAAAIVSCSRHPNRLLALQSEARYEAGDLGRSHRGCHWRRCTAQCAEAQSHDYNGITRAENEIRQRRR